MAITFTVTLSNKDWRDELNGWDCSALGIPSAEVTELRTGGVKQDDMYYKVDTDHQIIQWTGNPRPETVLVSIKVVKELAPAEKVTEAKEAADKWKQIAIIAPIVGTVLTALITAITTISLSSPKPNGNVNTNQSINNNTNKSPMPPEPKVHLIFKKDLTLDMVRRYVVEDQTARVEFRDDCSGTNVPSSNVTLKDATLSGKDVKDFFETAIKPRASNKNFCVFEIQKDNSYEISCKSCG